MSSDEARSDAASALRDLIHAFAAHDADDAELGLIASAATSLTEQLDGAAPRDRMALMRAAVGKQSFPSMTTGSGFADRAVGGATNPTSVDVQVRFEGEEVIATVVLRRAFEGAPGRAHGGIVAAAFDGTTLVYELFELK